MPVIETKGAASSGGFGQFARQVAANYIEDVFSTYLYTGTGADQTITNGIDTTDGQGPVTSPYVTVGTAALFNGDDFVDRCAVPRTPTNLNVSINTVTKKYGTGSFYFPGNGTSVLYTDSGDAGFPIGIGDFTVECWVYITNTVDGTYAIFSNRSSGSCFFGIDQIGGGTCRLFQYPSGASATMSLNQWNHVAAVRSSGSTKVYLNGVGSSGVSDSNNYSSRYCQIGADTINGVWGITGYVDDFRLCIGQAVYTSNFTPPTGPLPATATTTATYTAYLAGSSLVWVKYRNDGSNWHNLFPMSFGGTKRHFSNNGQPFYTGTFLAPIPTGFTLKGGDPNYNANGGLYASWTFRKQAKFFDVVTYTGDGTASRQIAHSLGSVPGCIIVKSTDNANGASQQWQVWHTSQTGKIGLLNTTDAFFTSSNFGTPTSTYFVTATSGTNNNVNGTNYVAYLFAHDAGGFGAAGTDNVISCGSFTSDGSGNATVNLGYEPQWVLIKSSSEANNWAIIDNMRGFPANGFCRFLFPNLANAEASGGLINLNSTGFYSNATLSNSQSYIYIAIRRGPMRTPTSGTSVYNAVTATSPAGDHFVNFGLQVDMAIRGLRTISLAKDAGTRLQGTPRLYTTGTDVEQNTFPLYWDSNVGYTSSGESPGFPEVFWGFRRAPGFFDVVCYTGTGTTTQFVTHNLGVYPELVIQKRRGSTSDWFTSRFTNGSNDVRLLLNTTGGSGAGNACNYTTVTGIGAFDSTIGNISGATYVAYLFASCPGVSKVGTYTGTGTTQQINCGFTGGARFVLIKRTDSTGDWYVWDSARGIVAGDDPYLLLNSTAAEVINTDYIDTLSTGFEISSTAPAAINANGGSYIFLAIA